MACFLFYDENFKTLDFGPGHPMRGDRYEKALEEFKKDGILEKVEMRKVEMIDEDILCLFHTSTYVEKVKKISEEGQGIIGPDTPGYKGIYEAALLSVSATIFGVKSLLKNECEVAINICGGWHHAFENTGRGFCIFNDIAVAGNFLLKEGVEKIMIIDYDAHHGDGTQRAFYSSKKVFTISLHQNPETLYPFLTGVKEEIGEGEGKGFNRNFPLSFNCKDEEFIENFKEVEEVINNFKPEFLILQMGVDGSKECFISNMKLTGESYNYASYKIRESQKKIGFELLSLGGGGFVHPMLGKNWGIQINNFTN